MARTPEGIERRREADREYKRKWRKEHAEEFRKQRRDHYAKNKKKLRAYERKRRKKSGLSTIYTRRYRAKNPEKQKAYNKKYYWANRETMLAKVKVWMKEHPDYDRNRHRRNPARARASNGRRKARMRGADGSYRMQDISRLYFLQGGFCHCGERLDNFEIDHIIPLSKHGTNWPWNLQLLCGPCNGRKSNKMPTWAEIFQARPYLLTILALTRIDACSDASTISGAASDQVAR